MTASVLPKPGFSQLNLARVRRRSSVVRTLRSVVPGLIFALLAAALFLIVQGARNGHIPLSPSASDARIINPRFSGRDSDGRGYVLSAASAWRDPRDERIIHLDGPNLIRGDRQADRISVRAPKGEYTEPTGILVLSENVVFDAHNTYHFETQILTADVRKGIVSGNTPVRGTAPMGWVRANSFVVTEDGKRLVFRGRVVSHINPR